MELNAQMIVQSWWFERLSVVFTPPIVGLRRNTAAVKIMATTRMILATKALHIHLDQDAVESKRHAEDEKKVLEVRVDQECQEVVRAAPSLVSPVPFAKEITNLTGTLPGQNQESCA